jgi:serine/threonine protein kinase
MASLHCPACSVEVDAARLETVVGKPRFVAERRWTGVEIDGITVEDLLGAGGMGTVYRARSLRDGQALAVKFLSPTLAAEPELRARFSREVALLEKLDHPGIVKVRAHGEIQGVPWFAMDLVDGPTLAARLEKGTLAPDEAQAIFLGLFDALAHAHARGVVHRDLKPANVLLASDGARLADFGIAHLDLQTGTGKTQLTRTAAILGTFPYMSPEQRAGRPVDARSDLYSVGVMLYEALAGQRPEGAFPPLHRLCPRVPSKVDPFLLRLLQPDPASRIGSALQAKRELARAFSPSARRPALWGAGGLAASALATVLFFAGRGEPPAKQAPSPSPTLSKSARPPQEAPVQAPPAEAQAVAQVPVELPTLGDGKLGRKTAKSNSTKGGRGDPFRKSGAKSNASLDADEPFLDVKNVQPAPMQQKPAPATQQPIPLLKSAPKPKSSEELQDLAPTTGEKTKPLKKMSKGGKAFPSKDFDSSLK